MLCPQTIQGVMMDLFADLHTHSSTSDGSAGPRELADFFLSYDHLTIQDILDDFSQELSFLNMAGQDTSGVLQRAERVLGVARNLKTIAKTDHNTLLGTEEMLDQLRSRDAGNKGKRFVVGTEISATYELPYVGPYSLHLLAYFHDDDGFDMLARSEEQAREFMKALVGDYGSFLEDLLKGPNRRWLDVSRSHVNGFFQEKLAPITEDEMIDHAKAKLDSVCDPSSVINPSNSQPVLTHKDIAELLHRRGVGESADDVIAKYLTRQGILYTPFRPNMYTLTAEQLVPSMQAISGRSRVKVRIGWAHPVTHVRVIARAMEGDDFYGTRAEFEASRIVSEMISSYCMKGYIQFVETDSSEYRHPAMDTGEGSVLKYLDLLKKEQDFTARTKHCAIETVQALGMRRSGGSDAHLQAHTPRLGDGFGQLAFPDSCVDELFRP
jgi:hypothetical protein